MSVVIELQLCEETGERIDANACPVHGQDADDARRGHGGTPRCAARYIHIAYLDTYRSSSHDAVAAAQANR